jgi:hypothetical protein
MYDRVRAAHVKQMEKGVSPATQTIVTDTRSSRKFARASVDKFMCITAEKGRAYGMWISTSGRQVTSEDFLEMHGMPVRFFEPGACGVSSSKFGQMLGETISLNVLMRYIPPALYSAGLIERLPTTDCWQAVIRKCVCDGTAKPKT